MSNFETITAMFQIQHKLDQLKFEDEALFEEVLASIDVGNWPMYYDCKYTKDVLQRECETLIKQFFKLSDQLSLELWSKHWYCFS